MAAKWSQNGSEIVVRSSRDRRIMRLVNLGHLDSVHGLRDFGGPPTASERLARTGGGRYVGGDAVIRRPGD